MKGSEVKHHEYECQENDSEMVWESSYPELEHCQGDTTNVKVMFTNNTHFKYPKEKASNEPKFYTDAQRPIVREQYFLRRETI